MREADVNAVFLDSLSLTRHCLFLLRELVPLASAVRFIVFIFLTVVF